MKTVDVLLEDQDFMDKYCTASISAHFWKSDHRIVINKHLVGKGLLNCRMISVRLLETLDGYQFDWKFVKQEINQLEFPEYYV